METAHIAVVDGTSQRLSNDELGLIYRRVDEIKRRITEGTLSKRNVMDGLQKIVEAKADTIGPCKQRHRSAPIPFKRVELKERKKSLASLRLRSESRINRLFFHFKLALHTGKSGRATNKKFAPEDIIVMEWEKENIPQRGINYGLVPIQSILETEDMPNEREAMIVNNTIQWLGTMSGLVFLVRFIRTADISI